MDANLLRAFVPFNALSASALADIAGRVEEVALPQGEVVFREGDDGPWLYFVLEGTVSCRQPDQAPRDVRAGSEDARHALSRSRPRGCDAVTLTPVRLFRVDETMLEACLGQDQATAYEVFEYDGSDDPDWMMQILSKPAFRKVPPANANMMFERFKPIPCKAGDRVIRQGESADYYYLIREGRAEVTRAAPDSPPVALAELGPGDEFGEEALLTGERRSAAVTMLTDGLLMRLSKEDFNALLKAPLVKSVDLDTARHMVKEGAQLVDVRLEEEYQ